MALNIKIDLRECYTVQAGSDNFKFRFDTILKNGQTIPVAVNISKECHPILPNVHNLSFGPLNDEGQLDDKVKLNHANHSKLFSTIVSTSFAFLKDNPGKCLGIDGSNNPRLYLYYRCIQNNYDYLNQHFNIYGIKLYARILRKNDETDFGYPIDDEEVIALPIRIEKLKVLKYDKLYNYIIFDLKNM